MRIATWNVNSMKARLEKIEWWLERAAPDVLLMQATKLSATHAPPPPFHRPRLHPAHPGRFLTSGPRPARRRVGTGKPSS